MMVDSSVLLLPLCDSLGLSSLVVKFLIVSIYGELLPPCPVAEQHTEEVHG